MSMIGNWYYWGKGELEMSLVLTFSVVWADPSSLTLPRGRREPGIGFPRPPGGGQGEGFGSLIANHAGSLVPKMEPGVINHRIRQNQK
jgi:hypothetical protein